jgi:predicted phage tail protein
MMGRRKELAGLRALVQEVQEAVRQAKDQIKQFETELSVDKYEVSEHDAPRQGMKWSLFEREQLEDAFKQSVHDEAIKLGRSSSSIRHRVAAMIAKQIEPDKWAAMGRDYRK